MKTTTVVILLAVLAGAAVVIYLFRDEITAALGGKTAGGTTPGTGAGTGAPGTGGRATGGGTTTGGCSYPVTIHSAPNCILQAFRDSGYMTALQNAVNAGTYPASYIVSANQDPSSWLAGHSYLYNAYSQYFAAP